MKRPKQPKPGQTCARCLMCMRQFVIDGKATPCEWGWYFRGDAWFCPTHGARLASCSSDPMLTGAETFYRVTEHLKATA